MSACLPLAIFNLQPGEMLLIGVVLLLIFGPRLPTVMRSLGKGISEFKKGIHETEEQLRRELDRPVEPERQIEHRPAAQPVEHTPAAQPAEHTPVEQQAERKPDEQHPASDASPTVESGQPPADSGLWVKR